ncbi:50S ribosomal protein L22 [Candidatus Gracilibacteria bacterium]|nr:MAG: 50S ribosomal protein L22 [Candidatus Gracilibacteria bacterium]PIE85734.1 MAG: 50S ribosomal protein L22 [Candidatus Gracilibacteria bacterium]
MKAKGKNLRISPKKLRVVAEVIRGKDSQEALNFLKFAPKKGANLLYKILFSAVKNAEKNDSQKPETLFISSLVINKGVVYKRGNPVSRGRMHPILKRTSNVNLELQVK